MKPTNIEAKALYLMYKNYWIHIIPVTLGFSLLSYVIKDDVTYNVWWWLTSLVTVQFFRFLTGMYYRKTGVYTSNYKRALLVGGGGVVLLGLHNLWLIYFFPDDVFSQNAIVYTAAGIAVSSAVTYGFTKYYTILYSSFLVIPLVVYNFMIQTPVSISWSIMVAMFGVATIRFGKALYKMNITSLSTRNRNKVLINNISKKNAEAKSATEALNHENREFVESISYAKILQAAVMPNFEQESSEFISYSGFTLATAHISGEFFWVRKSKNKTFIAYGDSTNTGVSGVILNSVLIQSLGQLLDSEPDLNASQFLTKLNKLVRTNLYSKADLEQVFGADLGLVIIDNTTYHANYGGVGIPLYVIKSEGIEACSGGKSSIGLYEDITVESQSIEASNGAKLVLISPSYSRAFGGDQGKKHGTKRLKELLENNRTVTGEELTEKLRDNIVTWKGENEQLQDIGILTIDIHAR